MLTYDWTKNGGQLTLTSEYTFRQLIEALPRTLHRQHRFLLQRNRFFHHILHFVAPYRP